MTPSTFLDATALAMADMQQRWPGMTIEPDGVTVVALDRRALNRLHVVITIDGEMFGEMFKGAEVETMQTSRATTHTSIHEIGDHTVKYKTQIFRKDEPITITTTTL